ncbi:MAG: amidase domain-containing protein [Lachnospiraceae bacterium]|nr:amidase domain-containing protein [Lachnospiraceae bacterium]
MDNSGPNEGKKWYYYSVSNRTSTWTGAEYFHQYMINNNPSSATSNAGLFAGQSMLSSLREGDVVQNNKYTAGHSMIISQATLITGVAYTNHLICQRSTSASGRLKDVPLSSKGYTSAGYYKIYGYY